MADEDLNFDCAGSSNLEKVAYDDSTDTMTITFLDGRTYDYMNVPATVVRQFKETGSYGEFFSRHIRGRYQYQEQ